MRVTVERKVLADVWGSVVWASEKESQSDAMRYVRYVKAETEKGSRRAALTAAGDKGWARAIVDAADTEPGSLGVPAHVVRALLRVAEPDSVVTLADDPATGAMTMSAGRAEFSLPACLGDEFPPPPDTDDGGVTVAAADFKAAVDQTAFAASKDASRVALCGVRIEVHDGRLRFAASDSYRVACRDVDCDTDGGAGDLSVLVPCDALHGAAASMGSGHRTQIAPAGGGGTVMIDAGDVTVWALLPVAQRMALEKLIPAPDARDALPNRLTVDAAELAGVVARAGVVAGADVQDWGLPPMALTAGPESGCEARLVSNEYQHHEPFGGTATDGFRAVLNPKFLAEAVSAFGQECRLTLAFDKPTSPVVCTSLEQPDYLYAQMPVNIKEDDF